MNDQLIRVFVGADRSQALAVRVLEHSIRAHTKRMVEVSPMIDLAAPVPKSLCNTQRTGFSFSRFCIPKLAGYKGKAIYLDADMLVFSDIAELWDIPFGGCKVVVQEEARPTVQSMRKLGSPAFRRKQCSVMLLDCGRLDWDIEDIVARMDAQEFDYDRLLHDLCILDKTEIKFGIPFEWNSLEHYDANTRLIHYTDMGTQPWTSALNKNGYLWLNEVQGMLQDGALTLRELRDEIRLGFFRPSLLDEIVRCQDPTSLLHRYRVMRYYAKDKLMGYVPHKAAHEAARRRAAAVKQQETLTKSCSEEP